MTNLLRPFHLAFPVNNIEETIYWYKNVLNCSVGRTDLNWVDFNFFGHQISAHLIDEKEQDNSTNKVDNKNIPVRHFGIILNMESWLFLSSSLKNKKINFVVKPHVRFKHKGGEQSTLFIQDPSGNVLEFKAFENDKMIFSK